MKLEHSLTPYAKIDSKCIKGLKTRPDTINILEENTGRTLFDVNCSNILFDSPSKAMTIKTQINQWDLIKLKSFCKEKETIKKKMKRQLTEWEKIFANYSADKSLISKIYKQLIQLNNKKTNSPIEKMGREFPSWHSGNEFD